MLADELAVLEREIPDELAAGVNLASAFQVTPLSNETRNAKPLPSRRTSAAWRSSAVVSSRPTTGTMMYGVRTSKTA